VGRGVRGSGLRRRSCRGDKLSHPTSLQSNNTYHQLQSKRKLERGRLGLGVLCESDEAGVFSVGPVIKVFHESALSPESLESLPALCSSQFVFPFSPSVPVDDGRQI